MRLAEFILENTESILKEWVVFARSLTPGADLDTVELRDHALEILLSTVESMGCHQTSSEQVAKSKGDGAPTEESNNVDKASELHGVGRVTSGFNLPEVVSEYRALRASVLKLWRASNPESHPTDLEDVNRFNESIDQSLTVAVESYGKRVDNSRQMFLAILGHDLRNPLQAIRSSASLLSRPGKVEQESHWIVEQMTSTVVAMDKLVTDLLEYTGTALGKAPPITKSPMDLGALGRGIIQEMQVAHPTLTFLYYQEGDLSGDWDSGRLRQMISNLLSNAVHHGGKDWPVELAITRSSAEVIITVKNQGNPIPVKDIATIFNPMVRGTSNKNVRKSGSIGLGLFITREVALAHGGRMEVVSSKEAGTVFSAYLPV